MPDPSRERPTNQARHLSRPQPATFMHGRLRWLCRLPWRSLGMPRCPPSPGPRAGQTARPGQEGAHHDRDQRELAGNLTDDPEVRYTEGGIARPVFGVAMSGGESRSRRSSPWSCGATRPSTPRSRSPRAAGSWSWAGSSSGHGRLRTAAPDPPWRSWPRSWGRASLVHLRWGDRPAGTSRQERQRVAITHQVELMRRVGTPMEGPVRRRPAPPWLRCQGLPEFAMSLSVIPHRYGR